MTRISLALAALVAAAPARANDLVFLASVPTLDEIGISVLIALVAGVAGWVIRRRSGRK